MEWRVTGGISNRETKCIVLLVIRYVVCINFVGRFCSEIEILHWEFQSLELSIMGCYIIHTSRLYLINMIFQVTSPHGLLKENLSFLISESEDQNNIKVNFVLWKNITIIVIFKTMIFTHTFFHKSKEQRQR